MSASTNTRDMTNNHAPISDDNATIIDAPEAEETAPVPSKRRLESRRRILAAARQLFVEKGYHGTRPQDISKAAGVGHGTFYLHFADKLECFLAFAEEASAELSAFIQEHTAEQDDPEDALCESLLAIFEYSDANPGVLAAALTDISVLATTDGEVKLPTDRWAEQWADTVCEWQDEGVLKTDLDPLFAGYVILGIIRQSGVYAYRTNADQSAMSRDLARVILRTLISTT
jgi:AcrR family transcriptional regulator